jgi:DNA polymerase-3 subunit alpha
MWERELLGLYLSAHPLDKYDTYFDEQTVPTNMITSEQDGKSVVVGGIIMSIRSIITKSGGKMAFVKLEDKYGELEVIVFPKLFEALGDRLATDSVVKIEGRISGTDRDGSIIAEPKVIAEVITTITDSELENYKSTGQKVIIKDDAKETKKADIGSKKPEKNTLASKVFDVEETSGRTLYIEVKDPENSEKLLAMKKRLSEHSGDDKVVLTLGDGKKDILKLPFGVKICDELVAAIGEIYGAEAVVVK